VLSHLEERFLALLGMPVRARYYGAARKVCAVVVNKLLVYKLGQILCRSLMRSRITRRPPALLATYHMAVIIPQHSAVNLALVVGRTGKSGSASR
jgi:hypothetical protein